MKIGYACTPLSTSLKTTRKFALNSYNEELLKTTISRNLLDLYKILEFNNKLGIKLFRISSNIIPFGSHSINTFNWPEYFSDELKSIGEFIKKNKKEWLKTTLFIFKIYYLLEAFHSSNCFCISAFMSSNPDAANFLFKSSNPFTGSTEPEYKVLSNSCNTLLTADI